MNVNTSRTWMNLRRTAPLAGVLAALLWSAAAAAADEPPTTTQPEAELSLEGKGLNPDGATLPLTVNHGTVLKLNGDAPLDQISNSQPDIATVTPLPKPPSQIAPSQFYVLAKKPGTTEVVFWAGGRSKEIKVVVSADLDALKDQLARVFPDAAVTVSPAGGAVVLKGHVPDLTTAEQIASIAAPYAASVINLLEISGGQQVLLKVRFAEVSRSVSTNLGFNAFATDGVFTSGINIGPGSTPQGALASGGNTSGISSQANLFGSAGIGATRFEAFVQALRSNGLIRELAEPNLIAMSGQEASFLAGGEIPIPVPQPGSGGSAITIEYKEFGINLNFLPIVMGDGRIRLKVAPEVSELDYSHALPIAGTGDSVPALTERKLQTTVELYEGQTLGLAGLLDNNLSATTNVTPVLGDLPILGLLFRSLSYQRSETELVVMVTPYLASGLNPGQVPPVPGEHWRYPTEGELFMGPDLGGPVDMPAAPAAKGTTPAAIHGQHGLAPVTTSDDSSGK